MGWGVGVEGGEEEKGEKEEFHLEVLFRRNIFRNPMRNKITEIASKIK